MKKDDIKTFITIIIICLAIVVVVLIINKKDTSEKLEQVNDYNTFFTITSYINTYITSSSDSSKLYDLTYIDYINKNNITESTIKEYIKNYTLDTSIKTTDMQYTKINNNYIYYVKGKIYQNTYEKTELIDNNYQVLVLIDTDTSSYAIYELDTDYKKEIDKIKKIKIENNRNNNIQELKSVKKEQICVMYLSDYVRNLEENIELTYNNLNQTMKEKYPLFKDYENYINRNKNKITTEADKCLEEKIGKNRIYTVIDKNKNKYTFVEKSIMKYEVSFYINEENKENE